MDRATYSTIYTQPIDYQYTYPTLITGFYSDPYDNCYYNGGGSYSCDKRDVFTIM